MPTPELPAAIITAAGEGTRIRDLMSQEMGLPSDYPKHLLPTGGPNNETLLGRIIRQTSTEIFSDKPTIVVTEANRQHMSTHPDVGPASFDTEPFVFSMDPLYYHLRRTGERVVGCAGDFYSQFSWEEFLAAHNRSGAAMSLLVNRSPTPVEAAVFDIDEQTGRITGLRRPKKGMGGQYTNVGAYIIEAVDPVIEILDTHLPADPRDSSPDDTIGMECVRRGLAGAICLEGPHFNVNTPAEYRALLGHTATLAAIS